MPYTEQFKIFREARKLSRDGLASKAQCHRNTVNNVESGRPVKFETIKTLMGAMGYGPNSSEVKLLAVLWLEDITGVCLTVEEAKTLKRVAEKRRLGSARLARLATELARYGLKDADVDLLSFAAQHRHVLQALKAIQRLLLKQRSTAA